MTRAMKWAGSSGSTNNVGSVEYQYCLACDGALSKRFVYAGGSGASRGALQSGQRYEYDGLNLLRVDEIYGSTLSEAGPWRKVEISTHQPGQLAALLHKWVYKYSSATSGSPSQTKDFTYSYDPVGNVYSVFDSNGNEAYYFTQDAFGNELPITTLGGDNWNAARADRIVEHQTGKWIDEFTELYYFSARWYDSGVGRFVGRDPVREIGGGLYTISYNNPVWISDPTGKCPSCGPADIPDGSGDEITLPPPPFPSPVKCRRARGIASRYGNYCGSAGDTWNPEYIAHCPPVDDLDQCCFEHDQCYEDKNTAWDLWPVYPHTPRGECDRKFCSCVSTTNSSGVWKWWYKGNIHLLFNCKCHFYKAPWVH